MRNAAKMKYYSLDLRQKIINVYETEPIFQIKIAKRFCVALSFVQKLLKQYRQTQDILPQTHSGNATIIDFTHKKSLSK